MEQMVQELEPHSGAPLAFEVVHTADTVHTVDSAACRDCILGNVAGSTARLLEFGDQLLVLD